MKAVFSGKKGISLIEAVLSIAIISIVFSVLLSWQWSSMGNSSENIEKINAVAYIRHTLEKVFTSPEPYEFMIQENIKNHNLTPCIKIVNPEYSYFVSGFGERVYEAKFLTSDINIFKKLGKDCLGIYSKINSDILDDLSSLGLPSSPTSVDMLSGKTFISLKSSNPVDPDIFSLINSNSETLNSGFGLNDIDAVDGYVFAAHHSSSSQLVVFQSEPLALISSSTLPGVAGVRPEGISVNFFDSKVYIGTKRTAGHEFHIFNVADPGNPVWLGSREINHNVNRIVVSGNYAYLATSGNIRDMIILDVSEPSNIVQINALDLPGNEDGKSVFVSGSTVYLGRHKSTQPSHFELYIIDISNIPVDGSVSTIGFAKTFGDINSLVHYGDYVLTVTSNSSKEIQIFDVSSTTPILIAWKDISSSAMGLDVHNGEISVVSPNQLWFTGN